MSKIQQVSANLCFGGLQKRFKHQSEALKCEMHFSIFLPPQAQQHSALPVLYWLSGLTCTDENFVTKAGAQRIAAQLGIVIVMPDTSPRGDNIPDATDGAYDLGLGAGFYLNATESPWAEHYKMYDYIVDELPQLIRQHFNVSAKASIAGHSMGGHGALVIGLSNLQQFCSISAFAPIVNPFDSPWGQKAFKHYLGEDSSHWGQYDACHILAEQGKFLTIPIRIDQGLDDNFLDDQMLTRPLESIAKNIDYPAEFHYHPGYDHSYFFIASFIEQHLLFHAKHLKGL
jgi:S-formylglutathione hydrolase